MMLDIWSLVPLPLRSLPAWVLGVPGKYLVSGILSQEIFTRMGNQGEYADPFLRIAIKADLFQSSGHISVRQIL